MPSPIKLSKEDARRLMVRHHFAPCATVEDAFGRLRSIQFDPIAPVGCNHDLVLQSRVSTYQAGDWQQVAYTDRLIYDGWDKQASLVLFQGWPVRRIFHKRHRAAFGRIFDDHPCAVEAILKEIEERGPLLPRECVFQERREDWKGSWHGPNVAKQTLRALWHSGLVMTSGRRKGHHVYDLTERVVPPEIFCQPEVADEAALRELVLERHVAVGLLRPNASSEVWSFQTLSPTRKQVISDLVAEEELVEVDVEGVTAHSTPKFLALLDEPRIDPRVVFVAPLDQLVWDRKMVAHLFNFDYVWEIYTPESKRRWGYYVLPIVYANAMVARVEFWCRDGLLELRRWHDEPGDRPTVFWVALRDALRQFMTYSSANRIQCDASVSVSVRAVVDSI